MATTPVPVPAPQASISPIGRIIGVFFSPKATFEDIVRKPSWILPLVISTILAIISTVVLNQRINWFDYREGLAEVRARAAQVSSDQKQKKAGVGAKFTKQPVYAA